VNRSLIFKKRSIWAGAGLVAAAVVIGMVTLWKPPSPSADNQGASAASATLDVDQPEAATGDSAPPSSEMAAGTRTAGSASGSPPSIDLNFGDVSASDYRLLKASAERGDGEASAKLYTALTNCRRLLAESVSSETVQGFSSVGVDVEAMLAKQEEELEHCALVDEGDLKDRGKWLSAAAEAGVLEAQLLFVIDGEAIIGGTRERLANPESVIRYRAEAMRHLGSAASTGNLEALMMLSEAYGDGVLTTRDRAASYGAILAAQALHPHQVREERVRLARQGLTSAEVARAQALATQLATNGRR
jgi:TPR repeat protein